MVISSSRFNTYLLVLPMLVLVTGCQTPESKGKKLVSVLGVHLEAKPDLSDRSIPAAIRRENPMVLNVEKLPFINEASVAAASVFDTPSGFAIRIQFDQQGTWLLEQFSAQNPGKHLAISSQFGKKLDQSRWLAAPQITRRIADGALAFTPDASREEADQFVQGLNNLAKKTQPKQPKPEKTPETK